MYYKGKFKPKNKHKYVGDVSNIVYRSRWESVFFSYLDTHSDVIQWASEELIIPYISPVDKKAHRYFPDVIAKIRNKEGIIETVVIEIKPLKETKPPVIKKTKKGKPTKRALYEVKTWAINSAKWQAAEQFCEKRGWKFLKITEKELGIK